LEIELVEPGHLLRSQNLKRLCVELALCSFRHGFRPRELLLLLHEPHLTLLRAHRAELGILSLHRDSNSFTDRIRGFFLHRGESVSLLQVEPDLLLDLWTRQETT